MMYVFENVLTLYVNLFKQAGGGVVNNLPVVLALLYWVLFSFLIQNGKTILICACIEGELDTVKLLCEKYEADPDEQDNDGNAPLHFAAEAGHLDIVKALLEDFDAEVDIENKVGCMLC